MSKIRIKSLAIKNYRSFRELQRFEFTDEKVPVAIVGYNNAGKTNLLNCIVHALQIKYVSNDTFTLDDFHNKDIKNIPSFTLEVSSSEEDKIDGQKKARLEGFHRLQIFMDGNNIEGAKIQSLNSLNKRDRDDKDDENFQAFGATRYFNIFYINFHQIKEEISIKKSSWGNYRSFLAKHIKKLLSDEYLEERQADFQNAVKEASDQALKGEKESENSKLYKFVQAIKKNYSNNLRQDNCEIDFGLPDYEDIFHEMIFKIGLNGRQENLVPIDHFGDGYIAMFVMAVIQAIAEENNDKCLFLFEEPESFLHENHQEYFYKMVLCKLAERGHQVIYTTHSGRMVDIFNTEGLIRLEFDDKTEQTVKKYNDPVKHSLVDEIKDFNSFIKTIEPNLNRILFSKKVILVEGPNDLMVYKYLIKKKVLELIKNDNTIEDPERYADTYLSFKNIAIIPHHGKHTASVIGKLCKHLKLDYFIITDWDFHTDFIEHLDKSFDDLKKEAVWEKIKAEKNTEGSIRTETTIQSMFTTNKNLRELSINAEQIHFNISKLEAVIGYGSNDKNSLKIWKLLLDLEISEKLFPQSLDKFLEFNEIRTETESSLEEDLMEIPF
jgi:putative ATP-dependent endonuclease of the OLD family